MQKEKTKLKQRIQMTALRYLLEKETHASTIHSEISDYDTYWIYFTPEKPASKTDEGAEPKKMKVDPGSVKKLQAIQLSEPGGRKKKLQKLTPEMLRNAKFEIRHFHGTSETTYTSPITAGFLRYTKLYWLFFLWEKYERFSASRKTKFLRERKTVLEAIMKLDDERNNDISYLSVARELRGPHLFKLPSETRAKYFRHNRRIIESLAFTGEVKYDPNRKTYVPTGKCIASLLDWEKEIRIHRAQVTREVFILILTLVIAGGTAVQTYLAFQSGAT